VLVRNVAFDFDNMEIDLVMPVNFILSNSGRKRLQVGLIQQTLEWKMSKISFAEAYCFWAPGSCILVLFYRQIRE
jgi:hypothetical protein